MIDESRLSHLDPETRAVLAKAVERIVAVADPAKIILFGSAAKGPIKRDSDLDLLVVMDREVHRRHTAQEIYRGFMNARIGVAVDVVVVTSDDLGRYGDSLGLIIRPALREGVTCYERVH